MNPDPDLENSAEKTEPPMADPVQDALGRLEATIKTDAEVAEFQEEQRRQRVANLRRAACVPKRAARFCAEREKAVGAEWWLSPSGWGRCVSDVLAAVEQGGLVAIIGPAGHGKTTAAAAVARAVTEREQEVLWNTVVGFVLAMQDAKCNGTQRAEMRTWSAPQLLVLDQADKMPTADWESRLLFTLLNERYDKGKATVLLCNVDAGAPPTWAQSIAGILGGSIMDRIRETGMVALTTWPALRPDAGGAA